MTPLVAIDRRIDGETPRHTLDPERDRARTLGEVVALLEPGLDRSSFVALTEGLARVASAQLAAFPETLFWDFEALAAALVGGHGEPSVRERSERIATLHEAYGRAGPIGFRYAHDFTYGFDWAKWAARDPGVRARIGPFAPAFLEHLDRRAGELRELIGAGSPDWPRLGRGAARNPFGFSREPEAELVLHRALARSGDLPLAAHRIDAVARCDRDFAAVRRLRAEALGLTGEAVSA